VRGVRAVFLAAGIFFRSPIVPALGILGWESINIFLPPVLKKFSVIHYLDSLCPVSVPPESGIAILADPASPWVAIPGILGLGRDPRRGGRGESAQLEILYGVE
jgi:hypothetical protein